MSRNDLIATVAMLEQNTLKKEGSASAKDKEKDQAKEGSGSSNPRHPRRSKDNPDWSDSSQEKTGSQSGGSDSRPQKTDMLKNTDKCFNCGKKGHWVRDYQSEKKGVSSPLLF